MIAHLIHYMGACDGRMISVDGVFTWNLDTPIVYFNFFQRDQLEVLQIMHGSPVKLIALWDWFDEARDKLLDRRMNYSLEECIRNVASTNRGLEHLLGKMNHYEVERIKRRAEENYARRNHPPVVFNGAFL